MSEDEAGSPVDESDLKLEPLFRHWHTLLIDGRDAFDTRAREALAGLDSRELYSAIISAIPTRDIPPGESRETTWDLPLPQSGSQLRSIQTGIAFGLAGYRQLLGSEQFGSIIAQGDFYHNLTTEIDNTIKSKTDEPPTNSVPGKLLIEMGILGRNRPNINLASVNHGIIAASKVIEGMRSGPKPPTAPPQPGS